jgi:prepilin-type N-terminal cleavage/methylation domain-containing protein
MKPSIIAIEGARLAGQGWLGVLESVSGSRRGDEADLRLPDESGGPVKRGTPPSGGQRFVSDKSGVPMECGTPPSGDQRFVPDESGVPMECGTPPSGGQRFVRDESSVPMECGTPPSGGQRFVPDESGVPMECGTPPSVGQRFARDKSDGPPPYVGGYNCRGFTVIEMIGVLVVLALLAAALVPTFIRRMDMAAASKDKAELDAMADALRQYIVRGTPQTIPAVAGLPGAIANELALPLNSITDNARRFSRAFLMEQNFLNGVALPYSQDANGFAKPANTRIMIVSSLSENLPVPSGTLSASEFDPIWNTPEGAKPSNGTWTAFKSGDDLHIKRITLEPLFHQLILVDHDDTHPALFSIDTNAPAASGLVWNRYYLDGTVLRLTNTAPTSMSHLLQRSISFVFEDGAWRGMIQGVGIDTNIVDTATLNASNFVNSANAFFSSTLNGGASKGASQTSVLVAMYTFMFDYVFWANQCPHFDWHGYNASSLSTLPEFKMLNDMGQSCNGCGSIDSISGQNGILK